MRKAVFLDRDGTINVEKNYLYRIEDFVYMDGAIDGLKKLQELGYLLIIVTNQSGIARGYYSENDYKILTDWMKEDLHLKGIDVGDIYYCPHHPKGKVKQFTKECNCRKPKTELFYQAQKQWNIDFKRSIAIGDKLRDLTICSEQEVQGFLLSNEKSENSDIICCVDWKELILKVEAFNQNDNHR